MPLHKIRNLLLGLFSAACLTLVGLVAYSLLAKPELYETPIGGALTLRDSRGATVTDGDLRGRYLLVYFGYTYCPDVCPTSLADMTRALERFEADAPAQAARVLPLFVSVDPERDTPELLGQYIAHFHPRFVALTGSPGQVAEAAGAYQVFYRKLPGATAEDYLMDHTSYIFLMDREGRYLTHFGKDADAGRIAEGLARYVE